MGTLVGLIALGGLAFFGLLAYLAHLRAESRKAVVGGLRDRVAALERENGQLRGLITTLRFDALRHEREEPLLAHQVENRITTHPLFQDQLEKELEP
jgi:hypothetical protein